MGTQNSEDYVPLSPTEIEIYDNLQTPVKTLEDLRENIKDFKILLRIGYIRQYGLSRGKREDIFKRMKEIFQRCEALKHQTTTLLNNHKIKQYQPGPGETDSRIRSEIRQCLVLLKMGYWIMEKGLQDIYAKCEELEVFGLDKQWELKRIKSCLFMGLSDDEFIAKLMQEVFSG